MTSQKDTDKAHFWFGSWLSNAQLRKALDALPPHLDRVLAQPFPLDALLGACDVLARDIERAGKAGALLLQQACLAVGESEAQDMMRALAAMLRRDVLEEKLRSELGSVRPGIIERRYPDRQYEAWLPLGTVVHVMPSNVLTVGAMGLLESLLGGNANIVKVGARDTAFTALFAQALAEQAPGAGLADYMAVVHVPSQDQRTLASLFAQADVISAWGGEAAIAAVRRLAPANARIVAWGHKVSFGYLAADSLEDDTAIEGFARDVCRLDQQACSSPQTLLVEAEGDALLAVADRLARALARVSPTLPRREPDMAEQAEITTVVSVTQAEQALGLTRVIACPDDQWRLLVDRRPGLRPSPLFRTLWVKPVRREAIGAVLRPMRPWLQTCGLAAARSALPSLTRQLLAAGVTRITRPGEMIDSYVGAPHDGVYALQHLTRRVSVDAPDCLADVGSFAQFEPPPMLPPVPGTPILTKSGFQALGQDASERVGLVVRSGGSSGQVAYSRFLWSDYARQMRETSHGLVAAGLEPATDRVMNLFAAGYMYGSFISFWTILEHLGVEQLPMAMVDEYDLIAQQIIEHRVNVLLGMTPHLLGLFVSQGERIKAANCVDKIFYGGEALSAAQHAFLSQTCGVPVVRSVAYGSNDAGPMGYQCAHSDGSVHHLFSTLQHLEIVALDADTPVADGEVGRLLLTSRARTSPRIERYEIGDMGRWVPGPCACGRGDPRFALAGRLGDVFKAGTPLLNYSRFVELLDQGFGYAGPLQLHVDSEGATTLVRVWVDETLATPAQQVTEYLMTHYDALHVARQYALPTEVRIETHDESDFVRVKASGKLRHVIDHRTVAAV